MESGKWKMENEGVKIGGGGANEHREGWRTR